MHSDPIAAALVQRCCGVMAGYYRKYVDDRAWPPVKSTNFINLALIKDQTSWRKTVQESVDEIVGDKAKTSYQSMLDDDCIGTFTLLEGRPGSGKTVLMNKIACDWAKHEILKSKLLIFIPLRRLGTESNRKLATLLRVACSALPQSDIHDLVFHIKQTQGEGVVFVFDGFDEYVPCHYKRRVSVTRTVDVEVSSASSTPTSKCGCFNTYKRSQNVESTVVLVQKTIQEYQYVQAEDILEILNGNNLTKSTIFVTSRPAACNDIREYAGKRIEVFGFLKPQIIEYIHCYFSSDKHKAQQLEAHLECHPNLMHMAYLPLHCAMLAFLYEDDTVLPETETEFYKHFTLSTLLHSIRRREGLLTSSIVSFNQLPLRDKIIFDRVCKLAFNATVESKQVFTSADIMKILPGTDSRRARKDVSELGLIVTDQYFMRFGLDDTYTFLHLTFQEYLAAVYISESKKSECTEIIKVYKHKKNLYVVWRFLCGMTNFSSANKVKVFKSLMSAINDQMVKIQCCYETQNSSLCNYIIKGFNGLLEFDSYNFTPSDCTAIGYAINKSDYHLMVSLIFKGCSFSTEGALTLLQQVGDHPLSLIFE